MPKGNLLKVVQEDKSITVEDMIKMAKQAASGMAYLEDQKIVHRDLALRNILVTTSGSENLKYIVKVADFGLSRELTSDKQYYASKNSNMPVKWTAPEALTMQKFSHQSDVWSFGICLYELFTRGKTPYFNLNNADAAEKVVSGYRLEQPKDCPDEIYNMMQKCWEAEPEKRIKFGELVLLLDNLIIKSKR